MIFLKRSAATLFLLLVFVSLNGQGLKYEYGHINYDDLAMTVYEPDSSAAALMLLNYKEYFFNLGRLEARVHKRIKILSTDGLGYGDYVFRYFSGGGKPHGLRMTTYNLEEGEIRSYEVAKEQVIDEKVSKNYHKITVSMPQVKVGSVLEFTYVYPVSNRSTIPDWDWQLNIPVKFSELIINADRGGYVSSRGVRLRGNLQPEEPMDKKQDFHYIMRDIPALPYEPYVFSRENYRSSYIFEYREYKDWSEVVGRLNAASWFGETFRFNKDLRRFFPDSAQWGNDEKSLIEIFNFVRDHFEWDGDQSRYPSDNPRATWQVGTGDSGDINSVLLNMLRLNKIEADPVLLSTISHGRVDQSRPMLNQFNNFIVYAKIGEKEYLLDATFKSRPYNQLPYYCLNGIGLRVSKKNAGWVPLDINQEKELETASVEYYYDEEGLLKGKVNLKYKSLSASYYRGILANDGEDMLKDIFSATIGDFLIDEFEVTNGTDHDKPLIIDYTIYDEVGENMGSPVMFINPLLVKTFRINPLRAKKREFPIEFYAPLVNTSFFRFKIPEGYQIEEIPVAKNLKLPNADASYLYSASVVDGYLEVVVRFQIKRLFFPTENYPALKTLFDLMIEKGEQLVVLKKQ